MRLRFCLTALIGVVLSACSGVAFTPEPFRTDGFTARLGSTSGLRGMTAVCATVHPGAVSPTSRNFRLLDSRLSACDPTSRSKYVQVHLWIVPTGPATHSTDRSPGPLAGEALVSLWQGNEKTIEIRWQSVGGQSPDDVLEHFELALVNLLLAGQ